MLELCQLYLGGASVRVLNSWASLLSLQAPPSTLVSVDKQCIGTCVFADYAYES